MITEKEAYKIAKQKSGNAELSKNYIHNDEVYIFYSPINDITVEDKSSSWAVYKKNGEVIEVKNNDDKLKKKLKSFGKFESVFII